MNQCADPLAGVLRPYAFFPPKCCIRRMPPNGQVQKFRKPLWDAYLNGIAVSYHDRGVFGASA